jgi:hypothetical protein
VGVSQACTPTGIDEMTTFAVLMPEPQPNLIDRIQTEFPKDSLALSETQWLISAPGTALELTVKLGIYNPKAPDTPASGNAVIIAFQSYFGRASPSVWDWIKAKQEGAIGG